MSWRARELKSLRRRLGLHVQTNMGWMEMHGEFRPASERVYAWERYHFTIPGERYKQVKSQDRKQERRMSQ